MVDMQALADEMQGRLLALERAQAARLTRRYVQSYKRLKTALQAVTDAMDNSETRGQDVMTVPAFRAFLDSTVAELNQFGTDAYAEIVQGIKQATEIGVTDAQALMLAPVVERDRAKAGQHLDTPKPDDLWESAGLA